MEEEHNAVGHVVYRNWCKFCILSKSSVDPHFKAPDRLENAVDELHIDFMFLGDKDDETDLLPVLAMKDKRTKKSYCAMLET